MFNLKYLKESGKSKRVTGVGCTINGVKQNMGDMQVDRRNTRDGKLKKVKDRKGRDATGDLS